MMKDIMMVYGHRFNMDNGWCRILEEHDSCVPSVKQETMVVLKNIVQTVVQEWMVIRMMIEITKDEAESLADLIECNLFDIIRNDMDIDGIQWLCNICSVFKKLQERKED